MVDKLLKKLGFNKKLNQNDLLLYGGIAAVSWLLATNYFKKGSPLSFYTAYDTATTTTTSPTVQELKDKILQNIIQRAEDVNVVITNLESIKTKIETYNAKLELLAGEIAGSRLPTSIIQQYLQNVIKEIADTLQIKLRLPLAGGFDPINGGTNPYMDYYQNYVGNLQDYYGQYYNQFSYYDPYSQYYQPNYYYPQTNPYYSYQQSYNPSLTQYSQQPYSYGYPSYGGTYGTGGSYYPQQGGYGGGYPQQGYGGSGGGGGYGFAYDPNQQGGYNPGYYY